MARTVSLSKDVVDEIEKYLSEHQEQLKTIGLRKISQILEVSWFYYRDNSLKAFLEKD
jgi:hypothetical protein